MSKADPSPVIVRDFTIRPLKFPTERLADQSSLKLHLATEDAKVQKTMIPSTESETISWTAKGGVKLSSTTQELKVSVSFEKDEETTELCNATVARMDLARHARKYSTDLYGFTLGSVTSSMVLLITCKTSIAPSRDATTSNQKPNPVSVLPSERLNVTASTRITTTSYYSLPNPPDPALCARISPKCRELERLYNQTKNVSREDRSRALNDIGYQYYGLVGQIHDPVILDRSISILDESIRCSSIFDPHRAEYLSKLSTSLSTRFERTNDFSALKGAIAASEEAVSILDKEGSYNAYIVQVYADAIMARYMQLGDIQDLQLAATQYKMILERELDPKVNTAVHNNFADTFLKRFERLGDLQDLESAISHFQKAVEHTPDGHPDKPAMLTNLGGTLSNRFERLGHIKDLEVAIHYQQLAVDLTPDDHPVKPHLLNNLGGTFGRRFDQLGRIEDLEVAIRHQQLAVKLTPDDHTVKPTLLDNLGETLLARFSRLGRIGDIEAAIRHQQLALKLTPDSDPDKPHILINLGCALQTRFNHSGRTEDLEAAIGHQQLAVKLIPDGHSSRAKALSSLGDAFETRFDRLGRIEDLEMAIHNNRIALELTPDGDIHKPSRINSLASKFQRRFDRLGRIKDMEASIHHRQLALKLTPDGDPYKPGISSSLGNALEGRFERLGRIEDLEAAIRHQQVAVELTPDDHRDKPSLLVNLGRAFATRFARLDHIEDMEAAIRYPKLALNFTPDDHPLNSIIHTNLGAALGKRFGRLGRLEDLEVAIHHQRLAIELTPDDHPKKSYLLWSIGELFAMRFDHLGRTEDMEAAIRYPKLALEFTPDGHPSKPRKLSSIGNMLIRRFDHLGHIEDLETAIHHQRLAVELIPDGSTYKSGSLSNLATALDKRFSRLKNVEDIEASISHRRMAIKLTPEGHSDRPDRLTSLADTLVWRFNQLGDIKDLNEAIINFQRSLDLLPDMHPTKDRTLCNLSIALWLRYRRLQRQDDLLGVYNCSSSVANLAHVPPAIRLKEAEKWALLSNELGLSPLPAYQLALDMLPRVAWLGLPINDQHALLEKVGEIVQDAMGAAIRGKKYELAIEWAEAGRSIAWQNFLNLRSPLDELYLVHPDLAKRLQSISQQIEVLGRTRDQTNEESLKGMEKLGQNPTLLALDWDKTVEEIRGRPGFESFLKAKSFGQLAGITREGPVVVLNVHKIVCNALIFIPDETGGAHTIRVPLPDLDFEWSKAVYEVMIKVLTLGNSRDRNVISREDRKFHRVQEEHAGDLRLEGVLALLWLNVVKPVIKALAYQPRTTDLPHIWWCATGPLAFLPIHAAGMYDAKHEKPGHKLSDYVVSSYTPTLSALLDNSTLDPKDVKLLAVAQADAPGASRIPNTEVEVERIKKVAGDVSVTCMMKEEATIERVLEGMEKSSWVHLACHGQQNVEQPMKSGLLLHDGKLELEKLFATRLPNADFAFLSACQTATGDAKVAEESVHLAAGMLFSGYKGVIATMWSIDDSIAPQIAEDVYRYMLEGGKPDRKKAAHALHYAVKRLREENKADALDWVPFIHIGR